jgi:hypothetical protein
MKRLFCHSTIWVFLASILFFSVTGCERGDMYETANMSEGSKSPMAVAKAFVIDVGKGNLELAYRNHVAHDLVKPERAIVYELYQEVLGEVKHIEKATVMSDDRNREFVRLCGDWERGTGEVDVYVVERAGMWKVVVTTYKHEAFDHHPGTFK